MTHTYQVTLITDAGHRGIHTSHDATVAIKRFEAWVRAMRHDAYTAVVALEVDGHLMAAKSTHTGLARELTPAEYWHAYRQAYRYQEN